MIFGSLSEDPLLLHPFYVNMAAPMVHSTLPDSNEIFIPGQKICIKEETVDSGKGTYEREGFIYSSVAGYVETITTDEGRINISVKTSRSENLVPVVGGLVTGRVTQVTPRFCKVAIVAVEESIFEVPFRGLLRKEDVRATEKDKVEMHKSFRPGDIVLCRVISIGEAQSYVLSTAENELGVILATSEAGETMVPTSWREMQCPKTLAKEFRKVAKPTQAYIDLLKGRIGLTNSVQQVD